MIPMNFRISSTGGGTIATIQPMPMLAPNSLIQSSTRALFVASASGQNGDRAPQERADHERQRLTLEEVQDADQDEDRDREQGEQDEAEHERDRRVAQVFELLAGEQQRADAEDGDVQPERGLAGLEQADLVAPVGNTYGLGRDGSAAVAPGTPGAGCAVIAAPRSCRRTGGPRRDSRRAGPGARRH